MSEEQLKAFLEKVKSDTELQEKLKSVTSAEAAIEIAKEAGFQLPQKIFKHYNLKHLQYQTRSWKMLLVERFLLVV